MQYTIEVRKSYIYINVTGTISLKSVSGWGEISSALSDVVNALKRTGFNKILVDGRDFSGKFSTFDRFLLATYFVKENSKHIVGKMRPLKIVFVANESLIDPRKFGETVARNRGLYGFVTDNMEEALRWLEKDTPLEE
jgi:hypothetical protein